MLVLDETGFVKSGHVTREISLTPETRVEVSELTDCVRLFLVSEGKSGVYLFRDRVFDIRVGGIVCLGNETHLDTPASGTSQQFWRTREAPYYGLRGARSFGHQKG
jgi:hypothetical protein